MDAKLLALASAKHQKKNAPALRAGDVVRVHQKVKEGNKERIQVFEGLVLRVRGGTGMDATFTVRRVSHGIGIERTFPLHLQSVTKVEKIKEIALRQARPYFLRNLTARQIQKKSKGELAEFVTWEDTAAKEEEEAIKAQQEAEAKAREEAKAKEEAEAEAKVAAAKAAHEEAEKSE